MSTIKVAINGFGRIGRTFFRLAFHNPSIQIVAINDLADVATLSHLLKYDSIHGIFSEEVSFRESVKGNFILIGEQEIPLYNSAAIDQISWEDVTPDIVIESTGKFKTQEKLQHHLKTGAKKVILTVPPLDNSIKMIVLGVNDTILDGSENIISNASCTTNNAAPLVKIIDDICTIEQAYITTVHSYTTDQSLHDQPHRDLRRARAAGQSIVPTTTGAAKALTKIFPHLNQVIGGCGIRVPVANGSLSDITFNVKTETDIDTINQAIKKASMGTFKGVLEYTSTPLVSVDIIGNKHSCVYDSQMTSVLGKMIKIIAWYDNETGYSSRLIDLIMKVSNK
jgi:glyceraldehyde 3-phosphate dehydrogenase